MRAIALMAALALVGCGTAKSPPITTARVVAAPDWRALATDADRERLRGQRDNWLQALGDARKADSAGVAAQGRLFDPDFALAGPLPPAGDYRCRSFRLGTRRPDTPAFTSGQPQACAVTADGDAMRLTVLDGARRPQGALMTDKAGEVMFLGTLSLSDEITPLTYGQDDSRDMIGALGRVGDRRWRLVVPDQPLGPPVEVIEIVPAR